MPWARQKDRDVNFDMRKEKCCLQCPVFMRETPPLNDKFFFLYNINKCTLVKMFKYCSSFIWKPENSSKYLVYNEHMIVTHTYNYYQPFNHHEGHVWQFRTAHLTSERIPVSDSAISAFKDFADPYKNWSRTPISWKNAAILVFWILDIEISWNKIIAIWKSSIQRRMAGLSISRARCKKSTSFNLDKKCLLWLDGWGGTWCKTKYEEQPPWWMPLFSWWFPEFGAWNVSYYI